MPKASKRKRLKVPFDQRKVPPEVIGPLCHAVGFIVVNWSDMETALTGCVDVIYQGRDGKKLTKEMPHQLKHKLRFLKKAFRQIPALQPLSQEALAGC